MGLFGIFKKNKENENNAGSGNVLEDYLRSKCRINTDGIQYSDNDIARMEKNCEILEKMGLPTYKELKLVPVDSTVEIEEKQASATFSLTPARALTARRSVTIVKCSAMSDY